MWNICSFPSAFRNSCGGCVSAALEQASQHYCSFGFARDVLHETPSGTALPQQGAFEYEASSWPRERAAALGQLLHVMQILRAGCLRCGDTP